MMNSSEPQHSVENSYRLESIEPVATPQGSEGSWFRYVIAQGNNRIVGMRAEPLAILRPILDDMVNRLNERSGKQLAKGKR